MKKNKRTKERGFYLKTNFCLGLMLYISHNMWTNRWKDVLSLSWAHGNLWGNGNKCETHIKLISILVSAVSVQGMLVILTYGHTVYCVGW